MQHEQIRIISIKTCTFVSLIKVGKLDEPVICARGEFQGLGRR